MIQTADQKKAILEDFLPKKAVPFIIDLNEEHRFSLRITKNRNTKLGDYRPPHGKYGHRISINGSLNKYEFMITLIHEIAHLIVWEKYKNRVLPHGAEWKMIYVDMMKSMMQEGIFPANLLPLLKAHITNPKASRCADEQLMRGLKDFDSKPTIYLEELQVGSHFSIYNGRIFRKEEKRRKRFICTEISNGRKFTFSPVTEVNIISETNN